MIHIYVKLLEGNPKTDGCQKNGNICQNDRFNEENDDEAGDVWLLPYFHTNLHDELGTIIATIKRLVKLGHP